MSAQAILSILKNGEAVSEEVLGEGGLDEWVIGREVGCGIRLDDRAVSRKHATLKLVGDGVQLVQKSEFAPLMVNGAEGTSFLVKEGDVIAIGPYLLRLKMKQRDAPPVAPVEAVPVATISAEIPVLDNPVVESSPASEVVEANGAVEPADPAFPEEPAPVEVSGSVEPEVPDFGLELGGAPPNDLMPEGVQDLGAMSVDEDGKTSVGILPGVESTLVFSQGTANVTEYVLTNAEAFIGRGNQCEIILNDKKSSRKHAVIKRQGAQYLIQDLNSANGIYINNEKVTERLLSGGDKIRIGDVEFEFRSQDQGYSAKSQDFLQVSEEPEPEAAPDANLGQTFGPATPEFVPIPGYEIPGMNGANPEAGKKKSSLFYDKYVRNFNKLNPTQKILVVLAAGVVLWTLFEEDQLSPEELKKLKHKKAGITATAGSKSFQALTLDQKKFVQSQHDLAFNYYTQKEYDKALYEIRKIFDLVDDYKNSREIENFALEGKKKTEALAQERKKREDDEKIKARVVDLVAQVQRAMEAKQFDDAKVLFSEILTLDPDNSAIAGFKKQIADYEEKKRIEEQNRSVQSEINRRAAEFLAEADRLRKTGKFHSAIAGYVKVLDQKASNDSYNRRANAGIKNSRASIAALRDPVLDEAKKHESAGEFAAAYKAYRRAIKIDPPHGEGYRGVERVRGVLHERAKGLYTEGVLAESYSDFATAKKKFEECQSSAPEDDIFYGRAKRRLQRYSKKLFEGSVQ